MCSLELIDINNTHLQQRKIIKILILEFAMAMAYFARQINTFFNIPSAEFRTGLMNFLLKIWKYILFFLSFPDTEITRYGKQSSWKTWVRLFHFVNIMVVDKLANWIGILVAMVLSAFAVPERIHRTKYGFTLRSSAKNNTYFINGE